MKKRDEVHCMAEANKAFALPQLTPARTQQSLSRLTVNPDRWRPTFG